MERNEQRWDFESRMPTEPVASEVSYDLQAIRSEIDTIFEEIEVAANTPHTSADIARAAIKTSRDEDSAGMNPAENIQAVEVLLPIEQLRLMGRNIIALRRQYTKEG